MTHLEGDIPQTREQKLKDYHKWLHDSDPRKSGGGMIVTVDGWREAVSFLLAEVDFLDAEVLRLTYANRKLREQLVEGGPK